MWTETFDMEHDTRYVARRESCTTTSDLDHDLRFGPRPLRFGPRPPIWTTTLGLDHDPRFGPCFLYTSDAADDLTREYLVTRCTIT